MSASKVGQIVEKLFFMLLAGACTVGVTYLRDINKSLTDIQSRMAVACEQISQVDSSLKHYRAVLDVHEARIDALQSKRGG